MTYASNHHLLSFGGSLPGGETWTMGLRLAGIAAVGQAAENALLTTYATSLGSAWAAQTIAGSGARLLWAKLNEIGVDGKYVKAFTNMHEYVAPGVESGGSASAYPNQVAYVLSLTTGFTRGLAHAGRLFFPIPSVLVDPATGILSVANTNAALLKGKGFIDAINAAGDGSVIIASKERLGAAHTVTGVKIGRVLDTMRSRRTSLDEEYVSAAVDPAGFEGDGGVF